MFSSLSFTTIRLINKCPYSQVSTISKFTLTNFENHSRLATSCLDRKAKYERPIGFRSYVSAGDRRDDKQLPFQFNMQAIVCQAKFILNEVKVSDMVAAPQPAFWYGFGGLIPFVVPPLSFMLFGYSSWLASAQLAYGATVCSFLGGVKWGYTVYEGTGHLPTWENLGWAVAPQLIAWLALLAPHTIGFLILSGGLATSAFIDLTAVNYPSWFRAMRLCLTIPAIVALLLSALMSLFH